MIKSCNKFCFKKPLVCTGIYIQILNKTYTPIYFIVQYNVDVRTFTRQSYILRYNQSDKINFTPLAKNIAFNVLNNSTDPPGFICNVTLPCAKKTCYELGQNHGGFQLIEVTC